MTSEHKALLTALESNLIPPQFIRRAMSVLHANRHYFDEDALRRYRALAEAHDSTRRKITGVFALPEETPVR